MQQDLEEPIVKSSGMWVTFKEEGIPDLLLDMRVVQEWPVVPNPVPKEEVRLTGLRQMYAQDYLKFRDRLEKLELEWLQFKTAKLQAEKKSFPSEWDGNGPCPTCGGKVDVNVAECLGRAERWLKERG